MCFGKPDNPIELRNRKLRSERLRAARLIGRHTKEQWEALKQEFANRCVWCGRYVSHLTKDHIIPLYQGGSDGIENIQPLCRQCNSSKTAAQTDWAEYRRLHGWES
jgi:5-methylcytosine-specific restriction endonuclease McrA